MEWSKSNKENADPSNKIRTIASAFRVKKCLFDSKVTNDSSPASPTLSLTNRLSYIGPGEESPYSLFRIKKKKSNVLSDNSSNNSSKEHSRESGLTTTPTHKKRNRKLTNDEGKYNQSTDRSPSNSGVIELAVQKSMLNPNLTGDFSKVCILPTINGRHPDLMTVTPETVGNLIQEQESFAYKIIDCRYPYEFHGGHIRNAINIYHKEDAETELLSHFSNSGKKEKGSVLIFYCEFSSERAPNMIRFLRGKDRDMNKDCYPFLYYPELYLIEGGYKAFYTSFKELCVPQEYKTMLDKDCTQDLNFYRSRCKSYSRKSKRRRVRSSLIF